MELARTLKTLWWRRRLLAVGVAIAILAALLSVYRVSLAPPSLESRANEFSTASVQILVDTPGSAFADLASNIEPLETRASVFARFLASPVAVDLIAQRAKVPANAIEAQGPFDLNQPLFVQEPTAEQRSSQIIGEGAVYRLRFVNTPELPIIAVYAQAPTTPEALRLANAVPVALRRYIDGLQDSQDTPQQRRVQVRRLGTASGGVVNKGADIQIALLVFLVVLVGWCMLLVPAHTIAQGWREVGSPPARRPSPRRGGSQNGNGPREEVPTDPDPGKVG
ncbi:MAG TPA: hypothetical protein VGF04_01475 [Solirubrobacterales bacterium]